ncbi:MAG TPA: CGNR zinc finger domain-containing protein [Actinomadura sp.]|nr:CGNR zinc finger domain-containing protein [Actinomadura sp.]
MCFAACAWSTTAPSLGARTLLSSTPSCEMPRYGWRSPRTVPYCRSCRRPGWEIVGIVYDAMRDWTWRRLKACPEDACNYTFYDTSRNGARVWCSMAGCGSKVKMRAYRARARTRDST